MSNKHLLFILALALVGLMAHRPATAHELGIDNESYVGDSRGHLISGGFGDCVKTGSWDQADDLVDCGGVPAQADAEPAAAPAPVPVPTPVAISESMSLSAGALFDLNSAGLKAEGKRELDELANGIKAMQEVGSVKIIGHTDNSGAEAYNQVLSERRASAVETYLLGQGVSQTVMSTQGMGESQPVASNATREGRAENRRVEIIIEGTQVR